MDNDKIASTLENIARLLEIKGENPFKFRAYLNAARAVETYPGSLDLEASELAKIDGIGKAIAEKIETLVSTGELPYYEELREAFPPDILTLFDLQGLGAKKIKALYEELGIHSITKLERACKDGGVAALKGFGKKSAENFLAAIDLHKKSAGKFLLDQATHLAEEILAHLRQHPDVTRIDIAGSYRRRKPVVHDIDFIVSSASPEGVISDFVQLEGVERVLAQGSTKASVIAENGIQCDLRVVSDREFPFALSYFTGSKEHNVTMRSRALERGWTLNEYRLAKSRDDAETPPEIYTEAELQKALGLDYIEPELRENLGEFAAAETHDLPELVEWTNLRGTFHNHTTSSDGRATLEQMANAARQIGLEYLGIADHSKSSFQANGLGADRLLAQIEKIKELNKSYGDDFRVFSGTECDILKDGQLDFEDEILAQLDYVVASVHGSFSLGEAEMTNRIIKAISNPYVTMLGHITGRILLTREPYKVNIKSVLEAAAETNTIIELNANPRRLELDWTWWPEAKSLGVKCSINPDAHSVEGLGHMMLGVGIARKGWLTAGDVINTLPLKKMEAWLKSSRGS